VPRVQRIVRLTADAPALVAAPTLTATMKQDWADYELDIVLSYPGENYAPFGGGNRIDNVMQSAQVFNGRLVVIEQTGAVPVSGTKSDSVYGLRITDAAGRAFHLTGTYNVTRVNGDGPVTVHLALTARATDDTKGPPVRIGWSAYRMTPVEVPFELANVPVVK
jgi:hypothetical protein